jgi:hypothetical protein
MRTLTWPWAAAALANSHTRPPQSLLQRLLWARLRQTEREILRYLGQASAAQLAGLGFVAEEITTLRQGRLQLPGQRLAPRSA